MFCSKCGSKSLEGAEFCQKCGARLMTDEAVSQTTATPQHESITSVSMITEDTQQAPSNNDNKVNGGLRKVANIGRVLMGISLLLLLLCSFFSLPINPIIIVGGVAIGTILSALGLKRPFEMTKIIELVVACLLLVAAIAYAVSSSGGGGDKYVQMVKGGTLDGYPQKTVGEAFGDFLDNPKWESGLSEDGERFVNVKGGILYFDKEAELAVQFIVDEKNEAFQYNACEIDGAPQNNFVFWNLLETIYNDDSALPASAPQSNSNSGMIGDTQSYNNEYGNIEVTLNYVEFVDKLEDTQTGNDIYPDEDCVFLRAGVTVENVGTEKGGLVTGWNKVVYDSKYEYVEYFNPMEVDLTNIKPLSPPKNGALIFTVPNSVAESDKSLVLNINDVSGKPLISYVLRPAGGTITDAHTSGENGSEVTYYVEFSESYSEGYEPTVVLYQDGRFDFYANMAEGINVYSGTYTTYEDNYIFRVAETESHVDFEFSMRFSDDTLIYEGLDPLGMTNYGAVFSLSATPPKSIMGAGSYEEAYEGEVPFGYEGNDEYAENPATTTSVISTRDFIGEFSYDASFEDPTGGWNNFYYLLEIGMDGSDLVVTTSWRGMYMFDHVRVSPDSLTGNTLVFDAITNDSTEPQSHSLTYIPAKDSPQGKDTIYIDGDETMPYVRE